MSGNRWFRMYGEFLTDPKVQMLSEADQRRFIMVMCMRSSNGDVTLQDENVAFQLRISSDEWATTKARLVAKSLIGDDNRPTNWDKRQYVSDNSKDRVSRHRAKMKQACNVTETPPDSDSDTERDITTTTEQVSPREVEKLVSGLSRGLGAERHGEVPAEDKRRVCHALNIADAEPLVMVFDKWRSRTGIKPRSDVGQWFFDSAQTLWQNNPKLHKACKPIEPVPLPKARVSSALANSNLVRSRHHA